MAEELAPPPYDEKPPSSEVLPARDNYEPSAPPPNFGTPYEQIGESSDGPPPARRAEHTERTPLGQQAEQTAINKLINRYVSYSLPRQMRKYVEPRSERQDPELDVEAQFGRDAVKNAQKNLTRKKRLRHISAWLWCFGGTLIPFYIGLPFVMIIIGIVGIGECPFRGDTIVVYLIGGGTVLGVLVVLRVIPSFLTCMRLRNYLMSKTSNTSARVICTFEGIFYFVLLINFIFLILGTYTTFVEDKPPSCTSESTAPPNCCDSFVFVSSGIFTVFQYVLYVVSAIFVFLVVCCLRSRKDLESQDGTDTM